MVCPIIGSIMKAFKVLKNGRSCHGGSFAWSLPADDKPGDWHEHTGELKLCSQGFHLTTNPGRWWLDGCRIYEVEYERVLNKLTDDELEQTINKAKIVVGRVRLVRPVLSINIEHEQWKMVADDSKSSGWSNPERVK